MFKRDTLAFRTLVAMARQRPEFDEYRCRALLVMILVTDEVHALVQRELRPLGLTEVQFAVLIILLSLDPEPVLPSTLAAHSCVSRASITGVIDRLLALRIAARQRSKSDRRNRLITLTKTGRAMADRAAVQFLRALTSVARPLDDPGPRTLLDLCEKLTAGGLPRTVN